MDPFYYLCFVPSCFLVRSLQPCVHLLGKEWPRGSFCVCCFLVFLSRVHVFVLGQVWYLIVSISDIWLLSHFYTKRGCSLAVISFDLNLHVSCTV